MKWAKKMKKIVFFLYPLLGHINPNIHLLKKLTKHDVEIICYCVPKYEILFKQIDVQIRHYPDEICFIYGSKPLIINSSKQDIFDFWNSQVDRCEMIKMNERQNAHYIEMYQLLVNEIVTISPSLIIYDSLAFWGQLVSKKLAIPSILIESGTIIGEDSDTSVYAQYCNNIICKMIEKKNIFDMDEHMRFIKKMLKRNNRLYSATICNRSIKDFVPDLLITHTTKELQVDQSTVSTRYLGFNLEINTKDTEKIKNKLYITRGTISDSINYQILLEMCSAIDETEYYASVTTGGLEIMETLKSHNFNNVEINKFSNQVEELLESEIYISHGGLTGVREAIMLGTKMIIYPTNYHGYQVGLAIEKLGCGVLLKQYPFCKTELLESINALLTSNEFNRNIETLKKELIKANKSDEVIEDLFKLL